MSKRKFKTIKDFGNPRKSERRKYLETMMADMGITSMNELSPEEQRRWAKAARPQPIVEKKLREMGYSIHSNTNKRSLGAERSGLDKFHKIVKIASITSEYSDAFRIFKNLKAISIGLISDEINK